MTSIVTTAVKCGESHTLTLPVQSPIKIAEFVSFQKLQPPPSNSTIASRVLRKLGQLIQCECKPGQMGSCRFIPVSIAPIIGSLQLSSSSIEAPTNAIDFQNAFFTVLELLGSVAGASSRKEHEGLSGAGSLQGGNWNPNPKPHEMVRGNLVTYILEPGVFTIEVACTKGCWYPGDRPPAGGGGSPRERLLGMILFWENKLGKGMDAVEDETERALKRVAKKKKQVARQIETHGRNVRQRSIGADSRDDANSGWDFIRGILSHFGANL